MLPVLVRFALSALLLAMTVGPASARSLTVRFPRVVVPPGAAIELCAFVQVPRKKAFDLAQYDIRHRGVGGSFSLAHFLVYVYQGTQLDGFAAGVVASRACLELGPDDRDTRQLLFAGAAARSRGTLPPGTAVRLQSAVGATAIGFVLDANFTNATDKPRTASSVVRLRAARRRTVKRLLQPILERTAEEALLVAPGTIGSTEQSTAAWNAAHVGEGSGFLRDAWVAPSGGACVLRVTGHFHKRGRFFGVDFVDAQGTVTPGSGRPNPFEPGRQHLFGTADYTDPGELAFTPPRLLRVGELLHYGCWIDNGVTQPARLGCEETTGVAPGTARIAGGGAAKRCVQPGDLAPECTPTDTAYPGRTFTGRCVAANLVTGVTPNDEVCQMAGFYYDVATAGTCDLSSEPVLP